jgi:hypothetical protein
MRKIDEIKKVTGELKQLVGKEVFDMDLLKHMSEKDFRFLQLSLKYVDLTMDMIEEWDETIAKIEDVEYKLDKVLAKLENSVDKKELKKQKKKEYLEREIKKCYN